MRAKKRSLKDRALLAKRILNAAHDGTESFRDGSIGADLAYLVWAVLARGYIHVDLQDDAYGFVELCKILKENKDLWDEVAPYMEIV